MSRWMLISGAVLISGLAGALFQASRQDRPQAPPVMVREAPRAAPLAQAAIDDRQLDQLADRISARMAARAPAALARETTQTEPASAPELTPVQRASADRAGQIVDQALARRELTAEEVRALRELGPQLQASTKDALRMRMIQALNRQQLKVDPRAGLP